MEEGAGAGDPSRQWAWQASSGAASVQSSTVGLSLQAERCLWGQRFVPERSQKGLGSKTEGQEGAAVAAVVATGARGSRPSAPPQVCKWRGSRCPGPDTQALLQRYLPGGTTSLDMDPCPHPPWGDSPIKGWVEEVSLLLVGSPGLLLPAEARALSSKVKCRGTGARGPVMDGSCVRLWISPVLRFSFRDLFLAHTRPQSKAQSCL